MSKYHKDQSAMHLGDVDWGKMRQWDGRTRSWSASVTSGKDKRQDDDYIFDDLIWVPWESSNMTVSGVYPFSRDKNDLYWFYNIKVNSSYCLKSCTDIAQGYFNVIDQANLDGIAPEVVTGLPTAVAVLVVVQWRTRLKFRIFSFVRNRVSPLLWEVWHIQH